MVKKGYIQDIFVIMLVLLLIGIVYVTGNLLFSRFNDKYQAMDSIDANAKDILDDNVTRMPVTTDWMFITILVLLFLVVMASFFLLNTHPALYIIVVVMFGFLLVPIAILGNVMDKFTGTGDIVAQAAQMPGLSFAFDHWAIIATVLGFIAIAVLFAKLR